MTQSVCTNRKVVHLHVFIRVGINRGVYCILVTVVSKHEQIKFSNTFTSVYNRVEFGGHTYVIMIEDVLMDDGEYVKMVAAIYVLL